MLRIRVEVVAIEHHECVGRRNQRLGRAGGRRGANLQHHLGAVPLEPAGVAGEELPRSQRATGVGCVEPQSRHRLGEHRPVEHTAEPEQ